MNTINPNFKGNIIIRRAENPLNKYPLVFNEVSNIVKEQKIPAVFKTGAKAENNLAELTTYSKEQENVILNKLQKLGIKIFNPEKNKQATVKSSNRLDIKA